MKAVMAFCGGAVMVVVLLMLAKLDTAPGSVPPVSWFVLVFETICFACAVLATSEKK